MNVCFLSEDSSSQETEEGAAVTQVEAADNSHGDTSEAKNDSSYKNQTSETKINFGSRG